MTNSQLYESITKFLKTTHDFNDMADMVARDSTIIALSGEDTPTKAEIAKFMNDNLKIPYMKRVSGYAEMNKNAKAVDNQNITPWSEPHEYTDSKRTGESIRMIVITYDKELNVIRLVSDSKYLRPQRMREIAIAAREKAEAEARELEMFTSVSKLIEDMTDEERKEATVFAVESM